MRARVVAVSIFSWLVLCNCFLERISQASNEEDDLKMLVDDTDELEHLVTL
jgi:hypothetical protein